MANTTGNLSLFLPGTDDTRGIEESLAANFQAIESKLGDGLTDVDGVTKFASLGARLKAIVDGQGAGGGGGVVVLTPTTLQGVDDSDTLINAIKNNPGKTIILDGDFRISKPITGQKVRILSRGATIKASHAGNALDFKGISRGTFAASGGYTAGTSFITLSDVTNVKKGDVLRFYSKSALFHPSRDYYYKGGSFVVSGIDATNKVVSFKGALPYDIGTITDVEIYDPARVYIDGPLRIENTGALPNGNYGVNIERGVGVYTNGLTIDNFVSNLVTTYCVGVIHQNVETERAWYTGTGTSYGMLTNSSRNVLYTNCVTASGRHGHAGGGQEPISNILFINCSIFNEGTVTQTPSAAVSFDLHDNAGDVTLLNCEMDSFRLAGNVSMKNCTVHHEIYTQSSFAASDEHWKANYNLEDITFTNGGSVKMTNAVQSNGTWTTINKVGSFIAKNWKITNDVGTGTTPGKIELGFKPKDSNSLAPEVTIMSVEVSHSRNVQVTMQDVNIVDLKVVNVQFLLDYVFIYQYDMTTGGTNPKIENIVIENCKYASRFDSIRFIAFTIVDIRNLTDIATPTPATASTIVLNGGNRVTMTNVHLAYLTRGIYAHNLGGRFVMINTTALTFYSTTGTDASKIINLTP